MENSQIYNNCTKRSKRKIKHQKISQCLPREKISDNNYKNFDLEGKNCGFTLILTCNPSCLT